MAEKAVSDALTTRFTYRKRVWLAGILLLCAVFYQVGRFDDWEWTIRSIPQAYENSSMTCPQAAPLFPLIHQKLDEELDSLFQTASFKSNAYELLGGAIRIPSESYDDLLPVGEDPRWDVFKDLHGYLESSFPRVYTELKVTKVNTYGLIFHWQGSESQLKPILLAAHQDVVPVDASTVNQWIYPPYSGHFDGTWIWGRGSADDKADLISQLITVNTLLEAGFKPRRTIVLAFGIDEEAAGTEGAGKLAVYLEETYGQDAFALLLDEGEGYGENSDGGIIFALPGISEKGYIDVKIEVLTPGGHSSVPPDHTSIGLLSMLIVEIEKHPHQPKFIRSGAGLPNALCTVAYGGDKFSPRVKSLARWAMVDDRALERFKNKLIKAEPFFGVLLKTTQAVDVIQGGVKVNALPEIASVIINHRIAEHSSTSDVQEHLTKLVLPIAAEYNLSVNAFGRNVVDGAAGQVILSDGLYSALEPSPVSPVQGAPYELLSGTIKSTLQSSSRYKAADVISTPSLGLGNTDTRFYWNLTRHIFRYSHRGDRDDLYNGLHTVNEAVRGESIIEQIRFFTKFILNSDESEAI
ncbi:hypothetical protein VNI00_000638 [Paramarasmius palmivorus]|uniref:Peptidase M20 dimerisation domain-containing protein n=1 Tax=Paramarasmius palmivorus TaxID=297713 RepID=A0AAW0E9Q2_9AGAR